VLRTSDHLGPCDVWAFILSWSLSLSLSRTRAPWSRLGAQKLFAELSQALVLLDNHPHYNLSTLQSQEAFELWKARETKEILELMRHIDKEEFEAGRPPWALMRAHTHTRTRYTYTVKEGVCACVSVCSLSLSLCVCSVRVKARADADGVHVAAVLSCT
jgi:hypothetical protein